MECAKINGDSWVLKSISGSDETNKPTDDRGPIINMTYMYCSLASHRVFYTYSPSQDMHFLYEPLAVNEWYLTINILILNVSYETILCCYVQFFQIFFKRRPGHSDRHRVQYDPRPKQIRHVVQQNTRWTFCTPTNVNRQPHLDKINLAFNMFINGS